VTLGDELEEHYLANRRLGGILAQRLAESAETTAGLMDRLAEFHEGVAGIAGHPLACEAGVRAEYERRLADEERLASQKLSELARKMQSAT
jgi:hypothetical protein